jgi:hypothetical protein
MADDVHREGLSLWDRAALVYVRDLYEDQRGDLPTPASDEDFENATRQEAEALADRIRAAVRAFSAVDAVPLAIRLPR